MLERRAQGELPRKPHTELRGPGGRLRYEECITRSGFDGPYTILYHERRPHEAEPCTLEELGLSDLGPSLIEYGQGSAASVHDGPSDGGARLLRRHYRAAEVSSTGSFLTARRPLLTNEDLTLSVLRPESALEAYFVNGDADELYFIHRGGGRLSSVLGELEFSEGDYLCVPRGIPHRIELGPGLHFWLLIECRGAVDVPAQYRNPVGQLRMDAPYSHRDFRAPRLTAARSGEPLNLVVSRGGRLHGFRLPSPVRDVVGWDGCLYPWAFSIHDFQPKVGRVHLPPTSHGTFTTRGALVCSFVPRLLDFGEGAIPCPYPHASVDIDEVIFYSSGEFGSRAGVGPGSISLHPAGIPHGPHPGRYEASAEEAARCRAEGRAHWTEELAVMLDCARPLRPTATALAVEDLGYHQSFVDRASSPI